MKIIYIHFSGYCLFNVSEFEEIGHLLKSVRSALSDIKKFSSFVKLEKFIPFTDVNEAQQCSSNINDNKIPDSLNKFVSKCNFYGVESIGIEFSNLSKEFKEKYDIILVTDVNIMEIIRWIRFHISKMLKKFINPDKDKIFLKSLSHKTVENSVNVPSSGINVCNNYNLIINLEINLNIKLQKLKSSIIQFLPEFVQLFDTIDICLARFLSIYLNEDSNTNISDIINKEFGCDKAKLFENAIKNTYGKNLNALDKCFIKSISDDVLRFYNDIEKCKATACNITKQNAPNLTCLLERSESSGTDLTAAKLIAKAGSLKKLAELPSTTIHTLTFQDSMLRKGNFSDVPRSGKDKLHSRESKILSDKAALASRVDYFSVDSDGEFGRKLKSDFATNLKTWADSKGLKCDNLENGKAETQARIQRLKLKRKQKRKNWLKRKNDQKAKTNLEMLMES